MTEISYLVTYTEIITSRRVSGRVLRLMSQLTEFSRQVGWRSKLMANQLAELNSGERIKPNQPRGGANPGLKRKKRLDALNNPSNQYGNPVIGRINQHFRFTTSY